MEAGLLSIRLVLTRVSAWHRRPECTVCAQGGEAWLYKKRLQNKFFLEHGAENKKYITMKHKHNLLPLHTLPLSIFHLPMRFRSVVIPLDHFVFVLLSLMVGHSLSLHVYRSCVLRLYGAGHCALGVCRPSCT